MPDFCSTTEEIYVDPVNSPDLLPPDDRQRATRREWETVFRLTKAGEIRTALLRYWICKYRSRIEDEDDLRGLYAIRTRALRESNNTIAFLEHHIPAVPSYLVLWRKEKEWLEEILN